MRITLVLSLFVALLIAGCGGEEMTPAGGGDTTKPAADTTNPDKPAPPKRAKLSKDATLVMGEYKMVKAMNDWEKKKASAAEKVAMHKHRAPDAQFYVGLLAQFAEDPASAANAFKMFSEGCPDSRNHMTAIYYAGKEYSKAGDLTQAEACFTKLTAQYASEVKPIRDLATTLGLAYAGKGDVDKGAQYLSDAAQRGSAYAALESIKLNWIRADFDAALTAANKLMEINEGKAKEEARAKVYLAIAERCGKPAKSIDDVEGWSGNVDFNIADYKGKVQVIFFWGMQPLPLANRCNPIFAGLFDEYGEKQGVKFAGLSKHYGFDPTAIQEGAGRDLSTEEELEALRVWGTQERFRIRWPLGLTKDLAHHEAYGWWDKSVPLIAVVDKKGNLRFVQHGIGAYGDKNPFPLLKACLDRCVKE